MPPRPYTASTTNLNTESPKPGICCPTNEISVAKAATASVTRFVVLWSWLHSGLTSSVIAAVHANTWLSAVDIVAAKIEAKISPPRNGLSCSIANNGNPVSAPSVPSSGSKTRHARPMRNISAMKGVCQTKNHTMACLRSLSSLSVMTRETT